MIAINGQQPRRMLCVVVDPTGRTRRAVTIDPRPTAPTAGEQSAASALRWRQWAREQDAPLAAFLDDRIDAERAVRLADAGE